MADTTGLVIATVTPAWRNRCCSDCDAVSKAESIVTVLPATFRSLPAWMVLPVMWASLPAVMVRLPLSEPTMLPVFVTWVDCCWFDCERVPIDRDSPPLVSSPESVFS